jgi:hypothetical protein
MQNTIFPIFITVNENNDGFQVEWRYVLCVIPSRSKRSHFICIGDLETLPI